LIFEVNEKPTRIFQDFGFLPKAKNRLPVRVPPERPTWLTFIAIQFHDPDRVCLWRAGRNPLTDGSQGSGGIG